MQLHILPDDVLREMFLFLPIEDLFSVLRVNWYLNQIVDSETQWQLVYLSLITSISADIQCHSVEESLSNVSISNGRSDKEETSSIADLDHEKPRLQLKDKIFPHETWKYNVQMARCHRWSPYFIDRKGNKIMNSRGSIIDESGRVLRFVQNYTQRIYRIANTVRPINTRGKSRIDFKVQMCIDDASKAVNARTFCSSWVLLGIIEESILRDLYTNKTREFVYLGEFHPQENIGYANNGFFSRIKSNQWTDGFHSGDVITFIVDAEHGYKKAKKSNWKKPYGRLTCLLNGVEAKKRSHTDISAKPDDRIYFCTQVNEECRESGIVTTIQYI